MNYPTYANITINKHIKLCIDDLDKEYYEKEGFTEKNIKEDIEQDFRNDIWDYIDDSDIKITIE